MKLLSFVLILAISGCVASTGSSKHRKDSFNIEYKNGNLIYEGSITEAGNAAIFAAFKEAENKPDRLIISSNGGEIGLGMALGNWIKQNKLDVEVTKVCASSCANYVFTAGNVKYFRKNSILIWHGGAWQKDWNVEKEYEETFNTYIASMREKETAFFDLIEVDKSLTTYGQANFTFWDRVKSFMGAGAVGYDYSLTDMKKFGISNIVLIDDEWDWRKYRPDYADSVKRVNLNENFRIKVRRYEI